MKTFNHPIFLPGLLLAYFLVSGLPSLAQDWTSLATMPTARSEMQAVFLEEHLYIAGGLGMAGEILKAFETYDIALNRWQTLPPLPKPLHHIALATANNTVYVSGGYRDLNMRQGVDSLYAFDIKEQRWTELKAMPGPRAAHVMVHLDDYLYVIGGIANNLYEIWRYDLKSNSWETNLRPLPHPREHLAAAVINREIYVVGGRLQGNLATLDIYSPDTDSWRQGPDMPTARGGLSASQLKGKLHVFGGEAFNPDQTFDSHEVYDSQTETWQTLEPLPEARHGLASASSPEHLYLIGGAALAGMGTLTSVTDTVWRW